MLRVSEIKLDLDHTEQELADAICYKLAIKPAELLSYTI